MAEENKSGVRNFRISVTQGMSGHFAVMLADYEDMGWNTDCVTSGVGRYKLQSDAIKEGRQWAEAEELPFIMPAIDTAPARQDVEQQIKEIIPNINIIHLGDEQ